MAIRLRGAKTWPNRPELCLKLPQVRKVAGGNGRFLDAPEIVTGALAPVGLSATFVDLLDDASRYAEFQVKTDEALSLAGKDVGTPIVHFQPQHGWLSAGR